MDDDALLEHVLGVLERRGARYRYGAPLDVRWMAGGWSSHFEFRHDHVRVRTDFVTRPPRIGPDELCRLWVELEGADPPYTDARTLAELKADAARPETHRTRALRALFQKLAGCADG